MERVLFGISQTVEETGNKAANLIRLQMLGYPVPEFCVVPVSALAADGSLSNPEYEAQFYQSINTLFSSEALFAVRSSTNAEDGDAQSFAGQFRTELYIKKDGLLDAVKRVALSVHSDHVLAYGSEKAVEIAVIIQRMIHSDASGVAFGSDPVTGRRDQKIISAVYGLGEGLVSGELDADIWKLEGERIEHTPAERLNRFVLDHANGFGVKKEDLPANLRALAPLNKTQLLQIASWLDKLQHNFGAYQDIEFAVENDNLYLLQTRPITTLGNLPDASAETVVWDNSNIVESYPGLTLPLTFSFILGVYEAVYKEFSAVMGIRKKRVAANEDIFANMLGLIHGRVYYNLNNWYRALALLPGYSLNAKFMEKMMGVKESLDIEIPKRSRLAEYADIVYAVFKILGNLFTANKQRIAFTKYFYSVLNHADFVGLAGNGTATLIKRYRTFENTLTKNWKAPLVNDFFCMIYFGLLQKMVQKIARKSDSNLHNDLLTGSSDVVSAEPVKLIQAMLKVVRYSEEYKRLFEDHDAVEVLSALHSNRYPDIALLFFEYIEKWGDRTVAELKLETVTYRLQPELLVKVLQMHLQSEDPGHEARHNVRTLAEAEMEKMLRGNMLRTWMYRHVLKKARYFVSNRENLRYERTRGFAKVREIFLQIGLNFKSENVLEDARDIFYLKKEEIFDFVEGRSPETSLKELVVYRKQMYVQHEKIEPNERLTTHAPMYIGNNYMQSSAEVLQSGDLKGIPCSAGVVRARVRIITDPYKVEALKGDIIVTESTDPGWTALFATSGGILVQRGSLLSHAAIVSREMGIPCIVGIPGLLRSLQDGDMVHMDGSTGNVKVLNIEEQK